MGPLIDTRTPEQAAATEQRLIAKPSEILAETQHKYLASQERVQLLEKRLGERQAREGRDIGATCVKLSLDAATVRAYVSWQ